MKPATRPRDDRDATRLLVVDPRSHQLQDARIVDLPRLVRPGDLLVVNDAATLPGSLPARTGRGASIELRLAGPGEAGRFWAVVFGPGDYRTRTEDRAPPPELAAGEVVTLSAQLHARVVARSALSPRLVALRFDRDDAALWAQLYALGAPIQYAHQSEPLALWSVQTVYASRPWAAEMPSAGRPLSFATLRALQDRGVSLASLTHAAGLSATGDPQLDAALPLPEQYEIPGRTVAAIERTRATGGRVLAVGTTVVRALEGAASANGGALAEGRGVTALRIDATHRLRIVAGILTGMHSPAESHYDLLGAFAERPLLHAAFEHANATGYLAHEFGDATIILAGALEHAQRAA